MNRCEQTDRSYCCTKKERKDVQQFYWKGMLTVRSAVYFYKAKNLILECCHPDNEVREKNVGA